MSEPGTADEMIPVQAASQTQGFLLQDLELPAANVRLESFPDLGHAANDAEIRVVGEWLCERFFGASGYAENASRSGKNAPNSRL
jgi:hypothetical protein